MTVTAQIPLDRSTANGVTTVFPYNFYLLDEDDLEVYLDDALADPSTYAVSGVGVVTGGNVTFTSAPSSGVIVSRVRSIDLVRITDYQNAGDFRADTVDADFDRIWMVLQDAFGRFARSVHTRIDDATSYADLELPLPADRAGMYLFFDASGKPAVASGFGADSALRSDLANSANQSLGDAIIAVMRVAIGAAAMTLHNWIEGRPAIPEEFGGIADGGTTKTDNAIPLQNALNSGRRVYLDPNKNYAFGSQILIPNNGGFYGGGRLTPLTSNGKFDNTDYGHGFDSDSVPIYALSKSNIIVHCEIVRESNAGIRTCNALAVRSCTDATVSVVVSGFTEPELPIVNIDSVTRGFFRVTVKDCTTNDNTLASCNLCAIGFDGNKVGGVPSTDWIGDFEVYNVRQGAASITAYGEQATALGLYTLNYSGANYRLVVDGCHQGLDLYGDNTVGMVSANACTAYGVKLVHGASHNNLQCATRNSGIAGLVLGSTNTEKSVSHNAIRLTHQQLIAGSVATAIPAVSFDGGSATYQPENNYIDVLAMGDGSHMSFVTDVASGYNNTITDLGSSGWATGGSQIQTSFQSQGNVMRYAHGTNIRAYLSTSTSFSSGDVIVFDTETNDAQAEYNNANGVTTSKFAGEKHTKGQVRVAALPAGKTASIRLRRNGVELLEVSRTNSSASSEPVCLPFDLSPVVQFGGTLDIIFIHDAGGTLSLSGGGTPKTTYLEISSN